MNPTKFINNFQISLRRSVTLLIEFTFAEIVIFQICQFSCIGNIRCNLVINNCFTILIILFIIITRIALQMNYLTGSIFELRFTKNTKAAFKQIL